jgi:hypothetical protein
MNVIFLFNLNGPALGFTASAAKAAEPLRRATIIPAWLTAGTVLTTATMTVNFKRSKRDWRRQKMEDELLLLFDLI